MAHRIFLFLAVISGVSLSVAAEGQREQSKTVRVATDATWPPMEFFDESGELVGFDIDLMRAIAERIGFRVEFESVPWDGIFFGISAGRYDVIASSVTILPERLETMLFSEPYFRAAQYLVVSTEQPEVKSLSDLQSREVGAEIATTGAWYIEREPGVTLRSYDDLGLALEDLINDRIAGVVADTAILEYYVFRNHEYRSLLRVAGEAYAVEDYGFAVRKDRPDLRDSINTALREIRKDGTYDELLQQWFPILTEDQAKEDG